jgi:hypothetical protein
MAEVSVPVEEAAAQMRNDGYLILPRLYSQELIERAQADYARQMRERQERGEGFGYPVGIGRFMLSVRLEGALIDPELFAPPFVAGLMENLLGPDYILNSVSSVVAAPAAQMQPLHKDHELIYGPERTAALDPYAITLVVPLVTLDNVSGTTRVHPGSHLRPVAECEPVEPMVPLGGALLVDYRLSHRGTPNLGPRLRPILYYVYSRPWFVDERNFHALPALVLPDGAAPPVARLFRRPSSLGIETW